MAVSESRSMSSKDGLRQDVCRQPTVLRPAALKGSVGYGVGSAWLVAVSFSIRGHALAVSAVVESQLLEEQGGARPCAGDGMVESRSLPAVPDDAVPRTEQMLLPIVISTL